MLAVLQFILLLNPVGHSQAKEVTCFKPFYVTKMWEGPDNNDFWWINGHARNRNVKVTLGKHALEEIEVLKMAKQEKKYYCTAIVADSNVAFVSTKKIKPRHLAIINGNDFLERKEAESVR